MSLIRHGRLTFGEHDGLAIPKTQLESLYGFWQTARESYCGCSLEVEGGSVRWRAVGEAVEVRQQAVTQMQPSDLRLLRGVAHAGAEQQYKRRVGQDEVRISRQQCTAQHRT